MIVKISSDAEADIAEGYWFYERQAPGLGDYFRDCVLSDIDSLAFFGGIRDRIWLSPNARETIPLRSLL
jgi:hypothetical protein